MHSTRRVRRLVALGATVALASLLAACGGSGDGVESPEETASEPADSAPPADDEPEAAGGGGGAACLAGSWVSDNEAQAAATTSGLGMSDVGARATVTGEAVTTFADGTMTTEYRDMVVTVEWDMEGQAFRMVNTWSGTLTGDVAVTDDQLVVSDVDESALELSYETFVNGTPLEVPGLADIPLSGMGAGGTSTYTCDGDELRITPVVEGVDTSDFVTVLHRR